MLNNILQCEWRHVCFNRIVLHMCLRTEPFNQPPPSRINTEYLVLFLNSSFYDIFQIYSHIYSVPLSEKFSKVNILRKFYLTMKNNLWKKEKWPKGLYRTVLVVGIGPFFKHIWCCIKAEVSLSDLPKIY